MPDLSLLAEEPAPPPACTPLAAAASAPATEGQEGPAKALSPSLEDLLAEVQRLREQGRAHFKQGEVRQATGCYEEAVELLGLREDAWRGGGLREGGAESGLCAAAVAVLANLAQCYLQGEPLGGASQPWPAVPPEPERALACCQEALDLEPRSCKALFRKGRALAELGRHAEAEAAFARAARLEPQQAEVRRAWEASRRLARPSAWPEEAFPTPLGSLGATALEELAQELTSALVEQGVAGYTRHMLFFLWAEAERRFGAGAGKELARVVPLVQRMTRGEAFSKHEPGAGPRKVFSYIEELMPEQPWHQLAEHPWCSELASEAGAIRTELRAQEERAAHFGAGLWEVPGEGSGLLAGEAVVLLRKGVWVAGDRFKETRAVLGLLGGLRPYEVLFVRLPPRYSGPLHSSDSNCVLTAHLALDLPEGGRAATLRVGGEAREWRCSEVLVFDHTYTHTFRSRATRSCVSLACRFYHPGVREVERWSLLLLAELLDAMRQTPRWRLASLVATETCGMDARLASAGADERLMITWGPEQPA